MGAHASGGDKLAEWSASGLVFKDSVEVVAVPDPEVTGVTLYISDFKRSLTDKLAKDFFSEPSQASVTCVAAPSTSFDPARIEGREGREVFSETKGLSLIKNKTLRIRRVYDAASNTAIYVAYSTRVTSAADDGVSSGRYRTSICAVPLGANLAAAAQ